MIFMRFLTTFLAGLLLIGTLALAEGVGPATLEEVVILAAAATLEGFMARLAAADPGLWDMRIPGTTGITVHSMMVSMIMPALTMTITTPPMCNRRRAM